MEHWKHMCLWERFLLILAASLAAMVAFFIVMAALADGRSDFCYVGTTGSHNSLPLYEAEAHRPWRPDFTLGYAYTVDEAVSIARRAGCGKLYTEAP